jgi:outer membrane protein insertion porin family
MESSGPEGVAQVLEAPRVVRVELQLPPSAEVPQSDLEELKGQVTVAVGQVLSLRAVRRSVTRLWETGRFADVVVHTVEEPGGVRVVFHLVPLERVVRVELVGNQAQRAEVLRGVLEQNGVAPGRLLDENTLSTALGAVLQAYQRLGYNEARLSLERQSVAGGVALRLTLEEGVATRVAAVSVVGYPGLALPELLSVLDLRVGAVLDRGALEQGLERLRSVLRKNRYWRARVGTPSFSTQGEQSSVVVPVSAGPRFSFRFQGNHRMPSSVLLPLLGYDGTEPLDAATVARMVRRLQSFYRYHGFHDARVEVREVQSPRGDEAVLVFELEEGHPLAVREVSFRGNTVITSQVLRQTLVEVLRARQAEWARPRRGPEDPLGLQGHAETRAPGPVPAPEPSTLLVEEAYREAAERMTQAYRERGYSRAQVRMARLELEGVARTAVVEFEVDEEALARVVAVEFRGGPEDLPAERLVHLRAGASLKLDDLEKGRQVLLGRLRERSYLFARVEAELQQAGAGEVRVVYRMETGPQVRVERIRVRGLRRIAESLVRTNLSLREGELLDPKKMLDAQRRLVLLNVFRQVVVQMDRPDVPEADKDVVVEVVERARMEGQVTGGYFLVDGPRVGLDLDLPSIDGREMIVAGKLRVNYVGWSWPVLVLDPTVTTQEERERLQRVEGLGGRLGLSVATPRLWSAEVGARGELLGERVFRPSYTSSRGALLAGLDWPLARWLTVSLQNELEVNLLQSRDGQLEVQSRADLERLRYPFGLFVLTSPRLSVVVEGRDDPIQPRRGVLLTASGEYSAGLYTEPRDGRDQPVQGQSSIDVVKWWANLSGYLPLSGRMTLALSVRGGSVVPMRPEARIISSKRFFLGGATTLRGFREEGVIAEDRRRELWEGLRRCRALVHPSGCASDLQAIQGGLAPISEGGEAFSLGKAELRVPASESLALGFFLEAGNLWLDRTQYDPLLLRYSAGTGLRYLTPVGPLALELGFNLDPDRQLNEPVWQLHFGIGVF